ncbi:twitching motility two-component system response regulator PilH [Breoghania corrubedonensis]|uniref:Twitching motility two-component system response regulator PilH n=1 Tax=Breoghania corrubedonensis TaxID=665038 RepID=A0A2T5UYI7_9HYPH|nr:response regulator [Breoghania corrubedonensis]PTW56565.1 twitching motility two-component system response regulator PilH [Breoghania corrubedonensis]
MATALIVDDDPDWLTLIEIVLGKEGMGTMKCTEGRGAFDVARMEHPDLIILDVFMPGVDGFQLLWQLQNTPETKEIPIVMVSSRDSVMDVSWGERLGAFTYISKNAPFKELAPLLAEAASAALSAAAQDRMSDAG